MKSDFKLYWVNTPASEENGFVVARSKRAAERFEENCTGFDPNDCSAELVTAVEAAWVANAYKGDVSLDSTQAFYPGASDSLEILGIEEASIEGDVVFRFHGKEYRQTGAMNFIASLSDDPETVIIRSVADLLKIVSTNADGNWLFRGHSSSKWTLRAGIYRILDNAGLNIEETIAFERRVLSEFIRRARIFLPRVPNSSWEWLVLAQHFGLPTRLLDWTANPLVALYFAVRENNAKNDDGVLYCYKHGAPEIDVQSSDDPFSISKIELVRPPHLDQRLIVQQSILTAEPPGSRKESNQSAGFNSWHVSCINVSEIGIELATLGISESTLFPGLQSLAVEVRRESISWPHKRATGAT